MSIITRAEYALNAPPVPQDFQFIQVHAVVNDGGGVR